MLEIRELWKKYNSSEHLSIYLSSFLDSKKVNQVMGKESEILMLGFLCEVYKENLIDSREPSPSLQKTVTRLLELAFSNFMVGQFVYL